MKCIVVDDDKMARLFVEQCIEKTEELELVGSFESPLEARKAIKSSDIDLILLDIEMPEMNGFELIESFSEIPQVIIISSKKDYAVEAFDYNVTDYLTKPFEYGRFIKAIERAQLVAGNFGIEENNKNNVFIKSDYRYINLQLKDIYYIEALADYVRFFTKSGKYTVLSTMKAIEAKLPADQFIRVHRSYIIRIDQIGSIEDNTIELQGNSIPVSRSYRETLKSKLNLI